MLDENDIKQLGLIYQADKNEINKRRLSTAINHINMFDSQVERVKHILSDTTTTDKNKITKLFVYTDIMYTPQGVSAWESMQIN